jgi:hypothetical protein
MIVPPRRSWAGGWIVGGILIAAYAVIFARFSAFSLMDYPNHLARAVVMADLIFHGGARFGDLFQYHFLPITYVLDDLLLTRAVDLLGMRMGTALWISMVVVSLPCAMLFFLRDSKLGTGKRLLVLFLSLYLSTDAFLFLGFLSFRLAIALTLVSLSLVQTLRRRWSAAMLAIYWIVVVLGYLVHLSAIIFLAVAIAVSAALHLWFRTTNVRKEIYLLLPVLAMMAWHFVVSIHAHAPTDRIAHGYLWGTWFGKVWGLQWPFMRYIATHLDRRVDEVLLLGCVFCALWPARHQLRRGALVKPAVLEMLVLAGAFLAMYIALPFEYGAGSYLDLRPLALIPLFLIIACMYLSDEKSTTYESGAGIAMPLAALLAVGNLAYLTWHLVKDNVWMSEYRAVIAAIPQGASVLPIFPGTDELQPFRHAASFAVIDRGAVIPYLFSGNGGEPQSYFRYIHFPYAPPDWWPYYNPPSAPEVDWQAIGRSYEFLLVMKPFEFDRIRLSTTMVAENETAVLLAIAK